MVLNLEAISSIANLTKNLKRAELTHVEITGALVGYKNKNKKIHDLIQGKILIQLSKGFYRLHATFSKVAASNEILSQLMYGPSYLSKEWALSRYGLIPEQVHNLTCVTMKKQKKILIKNENIYFEYKHLTKKKYSVGLVTDTDYNIIIATPLKALIDLIYFNHFNISTDTTADILEYLKNDLRLDLDHFLSMVLRTDILSYKLIYIRHLKIKNVLNFLLQKVA